MSLATELRAVMTESYLTTNDATSYTSPIGGQTWIDFDPPAGILRVALPECDDEEVAVYMFDGHAAEWSARFDAATPTDLVLSFIERAIADR